MRSGLGLLILLTACAPATAPEPVVPVVVTDVAARSAVGQVATVTGLVAQVKAGSHRGVGYLNFGAPFPGHTFAVLIPDSAAPRFGDLTRFEGHRARATGLVWLQDAKYPAMTLTDPAALELLP